MIRRDPVHAGDPDAVIATGANRARHMSAMPLVVERIACIGDRIEPVRTRRAIDHYAADIDGERRRRRPDVGGQVRMRVVHAGIDDTYDNRSRSGGNVPRFRRIDVCVRDSGNAQDRLTRVVETPQVGEVGVVPITAFPTM